jgi:hypothetical protein
MLVMPAGIKPVTAFLAELVAMLEIALPNAPPPKASLITPPAPLVMESTAPPMALFKPCFAKELATSL